MRVQKDAQVGVFVDCHCVVGDLLVHHAEEVWKNSLQVQYVNLIVLAGFITQKHLVKCFPHNSLNLETSHRAEIKGVEHILAEDICMSAKDINFLD